MRTGAALLAVVVGALAISLPRVARAGGDDFSYQPPGTLVAGSGQGRVDTNVYVPGMRFPIEAAPAYANSQVWGHGGGSGPGGSQCDVENFSYPWWDNYCETRSWDMPLCPSGQGHQGQDIRAATCEKNVHWVVASEAGTVTNVGSYSVYVTADDGTRYDYLHMGSVQVGVGQEVTKGQRLGRVSNEFGGTPTTVHLHFNLRQSVQGVGTVYVPPYMSLVTSYQALIGPPPNPAQGVLESASCSSLAGWAVTPEDMSAAIDVRLYFDGEKGDGQTVGHPILADLPGMCGAQSCENGFDVFPPLSLFDGQDHSVRGYASDGGPLAPELGESPRSFQCAFELPSGVLRLVPSEDTKRAWLLSTFWDEVSVSAGVVGTLAEGPELGGPELVRDGSGALFVVDRGVRRPFASEKSQRAWAVSESLAALVSDADLAALPLGKPMRERPVVLRAPDGRLHLVDDADVTLEQGSGTGGSDQLDDGGADPEGGCDCRSASGAGSSRGGALALLALLGLAAFRRRR